jgi:hypothetical protein
MALEAILPGLTNNLQFCIMINYIGLNCRGREGCAGIKAVARVL